jgi:hypothetical protein
LADNIATSLDKNNSQQIVTTATGDEDEEYDIPDEIEDILGILVLSLYIHVHQIMSRPPFMDRHIVFICLSVSELRQVSGFSPGTPVSSTNKTDHQNMTEILLKVA